MEEEIPKKEPKKKEEPTLAEIESASLFGEDEGFSLEKLATERLTSQELKTLKKIAHLVAKVGMRYREACGMIDIPYEDFEELMQREPVVAKVVRIKELRFKKDLMYTISSRARSGNEKLALWLLERLYPEEFGGGKEEKPESADVLKDALNYIRSSGSNNPLVNENNAKSINPHSEYSSGSQGKIADIEAILGGYSDKGEE